MLPQRKAIYKVMFYMCVCVCLHCVLCVMSSLYIKAVLYLVICTLYITYLYI